MYMNDHYAKVSNEKRIELLRLIEQEGYSIVRAAKKLDIKYNNAKYIVRTFRIEGRAIKITHYERFHNRRIRANSVESSASHPNVDENSESQSLGSYQSNSVSKISSQNFDSDEREDE